MRRGVWDSLAPEAPPPPPPLPSAAAAHPKKKESCLPANNRETPTTFPFLSSPSTHTELCCGAWGLGAWPPGGPSPSSCAAVGLCSFAAFWRIFPESHSARRNKREVIDLLQSPFYCPSLAFLSGQQHIAVASSPGSYPAAISVPFLKYRPLRKLCSDNLDKNTHQHAFCIKHVKEGLFTKTLEFDGIILGSSRR